MTGLTIKPFNLTDGSQINSCDIEVSILACYLSTLSGIVQSMNDGAFQVQLVGYADEGEELFRVSGSGTIS